MNGFDLLILALAALFGIAGLRQGFVVSVVSLAGFVVGGLVGLTVIPLVLGNQQQGTLRSVLAVLALLVTASLGQAIAGVGAARLKRHITWRPARAVDAVGGALVSIVAVLVAAWLVGTALVRADGTIPFAADARTSKVLSTVDSLAPTSPDQVFSAFGNLLDSTGFPRIYDRQALNQLTPVPAPTSGIVSAAGVRAAERVVVKVIGSALSCSRRIEGSGFVYAPQRVMTNAHVVAGVTRPRVYVNGSGDGYAARVVVFDPKTDVAVLYVPGLPLSALRFGAVPDRGGDVVALGYPNDGPLTASPGRVRGIINAAGEDIYGNATVTRQVIAVRAVVRPGNSGGPLVDIAGRVVGVVFAASVDDPETGYALTVQEVSAAAATGRTRTAAVSTGPCA